MTEDSNPRTQTATLDNITIAGTMFSSILYTAYTALADCLSDQPKYDELLPFFVCLIATKTAAGILGKNCLPMLPDDNKLCNVARGADSALTIISCLSAAMIAQATKHASSGMTLFGKCLAGGFISYCLNILKKISDSLNTNTPANTDKNIQYDNQLKKPLTLDDNQVTSLFTPV